MNSNVTVHIHPDSGRVFYRTNATGGGTDTGAGAEGGGDAGAGGGTTSTWEAPLHPTSLYQQFEEAGYGLVDAAAWCVSHACVVRG